MDDKSLTQCCRPPGWTVASFHLVQPINGDGWCKLSGLIDLARLLFVILFFFLPSKRPMETVVLELQLWNGSDLFNQKQRQPISSEPSRVLPRFFISQRPVTNLTAACVQTANSRCASGGSVETPAAPSGPGSWMGWGSPLCLSTVVSPGGAWGGETSGSQSVCLFALCESKWNLTLTFVSVQVREAAPTQVPGCGVSCGSGER